MKTSFHCFLRRRLCSFPGLLLAAVPFLPMPMGLLQTPTLRKPAPTIQSTARSADKAALDARLLKAVQQKSVKRVEALLKAGADANVQDKSRYHLPALAFAAHAGNEPIAKLLLRYGARVNGFHNRFAMPLFAAIDRGESDYSHTIGIVRLLLEHGAEPNIDDEGRTAAELTLMDNHHELLALLIKHGLKIDQPTHGGPTLLEKAVSYENPLAVKMLLAAGASPNPLNGNGNSPLSWATSEAVKKELRAGGAKEIQTPLPEGVNLSTPLATVDSFEKAVNRADVTAMAVCIVYGKPATAVKRMEWLTNGLQKDALTVHFTVENLKVRGDHATAMLTTHFEPADNSDGYGRMDLIDSVEMHREGGRWLLWSYSPEQYGGLSEIGFVNELVNDFGQSERKLSPLEVADAAECQVHMMMLVDKLIEYAKSHRGILAIRQETMFARAGAQFEIDFMRRCPRAVYEKISYQFNKQLTDKKLSRVTDPDNTIMIYEGNGPKPEFRHGGQALVALCSGRCALLSADQLRRLKWTAR